LTDDGLVELAISLAKNEGKLLDVIEEFRSDEKALWLEFTFYIGSIVDHVIDLHEIVGGGGKVDICAKPLLDAIRKEMMEQVERIDKLTFEE
jgi:hypothetical protein